MSVISIAICDSIETEANSLREILTELIPNSKIRIFRSTELFLVDFQNRNSYRAIFLRMEINGMNGIETAKEIRKKDAFVPLIIMCGFEKYYKDAFEVFAWQYLLTPISFEDAERAIYPLKLKWDNEKEPVLYYKYNSQMNTIPHSRILYISSSLHNVNIHLDDGTCVHCRTKIDKFEEQLENSTFIRCHQSFFVNMEAVKRLCGNTFVIGDDIIPISRSRLKKVQEQYSLYLKHY